MRYLFASLIGFVFGSVPFASVFSHLFAHKNISEEGSGNPGTTNVIRVVGFLPGTLTFVCDCAKTVAAVLLARFFFGQEAELFAGVGAIIGHDFSPFLKFKGGKGVAATIALTAAVDWRLLVVVIPAAVAAAVTGRMAVGSVVLACVLPFAAALFGLGYVYTAAFSVLGVLMIARHRTNFVFRERVSFEKEKN